MNNPTQVTPEVSDYQSFIASKLQLHIPVGFTPSDLSGYGLFDFQESVVSWAIQRGRAAVFADTGLGKTSMMLAWADQVGIAAIRDVLTNLGSSYGEDRYRISPLIQRAVFAGRKLHD